MLKINHKDSINDFGNQFKYHNRIDEFLGSLELLNKKIIPAIKKNS